MPAGVKVVPSSETEAYVPTTSVAEETGRPCASSTLPIGSCTL